MTHPGSATWAVTASHQRAGTLGQSPMFSTSVATRASLGSFPSHEPESSPPQQNKFCKPKPSRIPSLQKRVNAVGWHPSSLHSGHVHWPRGATDVALNVWVTKEQEGLKEEHALRILLLLCNPDTQSSVWATPPPRRLAYAGTNSRNRFRKNAIPCQAQIFISPGHARCGWFCSNPQTGLHSFSKPNSRKWATLAVAK